jgi:hypothetical protein
MRAWVDRCLTVARVGYVTTIRLLLVYYYLNKERLYMFLSPAHQSSLMNPHPPRGPLCCMHVRINLIPWFPFLPPATKTSSLPSPPRATSPSSRRQQHINSIFPDRRLCRRTLLIPDRRPCSATEAAPFCWRRKEARRRPEVRGPRAQSDSGCPSPQRRRLQRPPHGNEHSRGGNASSSATTRLPAMAWLALRPQATFHGRSTAPSLSQQWRRRPLLPRRRQVLPQRLLVQRRRPFCSLGSARCKKRN